MKAFCAIAERRSFSKAAESLGLTQPTVSFQVSSLEEELGTRLFDRGVKEVTLTKSGEVLYRYAQRISELTIEARKAVDQLKGLVVGDLTIAASTIPAEYILPRPLCQFKEKYPGIEVNLMVTDSSDVINRVLENKVEVGMVGARQKDNKLVFTKIASDRLVLIAPVPNRWFEGDTIAASELKRSPFVVRESGSGTRASLKQRLREVDINEDEFEVVMTLGSTAAVKKAVECGAGVSIVSERAVENEVNLGLIQKIYVTGMDLSRDFYTVHKRQRVLSPAATALLQFLEERKEQL